MAERPLAIDLFCGRGGWTKGLLRAGFRVIGYDVMTRKSWAYPGELVLQDVATIDGKCLQSADLIIGSPPCTEFSKAKRNPDPETGMVLVDHFLRIIGEAKPRLWAMENVTSLAKRLQATPVWQFHHSIGGWRYLWGTIPIGLTPHYRSTRRMWNPKGNIPSVRDPWKRAEIEPVISDIVAKAAMEVICG